MGRYPDWLADRCIEVFLALYAIVHFNTYLIVDLYAYQQETVPTYHSNMRTPPWYFFIGVLGMRVIFILMKRNWNVWMEALLILALFAVCFVVSSWPEKRIEHFIYIASLKRACYATTQALVRISQLFVLMIWYLVRWHKTEPFELICRPTVTIVTLLGGCAICFAISIALTAFHLNGISLHF